MLHFRCFYTTMYRLSMRVASVFITCTFRLEPEQPPRGWFLINDYDYDYDYD